MRKSVDSQTEKACVAYVLGTQAGTVIEPCQAYAAGLVDVPETIQPPAIFFKAISPEQIGYDSGIYELKLMVRLSTQVDDEQDEVGKDVHRERLEFLRDMLEYVPAIQAFVNAPATGPDTRTVQSYTLSCIVYEDDQTTMVGRKLETEITYYVAASPSG